MFTDQTAKYRRAAPLGVKAKNGLEKVDLKSVFSGQAFGGARTAHGNNPHQRRNENGEIRESPKSARIPGQPLKVQSAGDKVMDDKIMTESPSFGHALTGKWELFRQSLFCHTLFSRRAKIFISWRAWDAGMRDPMFFKTQKDAIAGIRRATNGKAARETNAALADIERAMREAGAAAGANREKLFCRDKTHLAPEGHQVIATTVLEASAAQGKTGL